MVKGHSDSERGNQMPPHGLLFPISSKGSFICIINGYMPSDIWRKKTFRRQRQPITTTTWATLSD